MRILDSSVITHNMELFVARINDDKSSGAVHKIKVKESPSSHDPDSISFDYGTFQTNGIYCLAINKQYQTWENQIITSTDRGNDLSVRFDEIGIVPRGIVPRLNTFHETFDNLNEAKYYIGHVLGLNTPSAYEDYDRAMKVI